MKMNSFVKPALSILSCAAIVWSSASFAHDDTTLNAALNTQSTAAKAVQIAANHVLNSRQSQADAQLLISSVEGNRLSVIEQLVTEGVDINTPALGDGTALMIAVTRGNMTMVEGLIELGADVNQISPGDGNPLIVASKFGQLKMVKKLLEEGADVDAIVKGDETALINASTSDELAIVKWLVEQGADVNLGVNANTRSGSEFRTPLNRAGSAEVRDYLVSQGATE